MGSRSAPDEEITAGWTESEVAARTPDLKRGRTEQLRMVAAGARALHAAIHDTGFAEASLGGLIDRMWPGYRWIYAGTPERCDTGQTIYLASIMNRFRAAIYVDYGWAVPRGTKAPYPDPETLWAETGTSLRLRALSDSVFVYRWHGFGVEDLLAAIAHPHLNRYDDLLDADQTRRLVVRDISANPTPWSTGSRPSA